MARGADKERKSFSVVRSRADLGGAVSALMAGGAGLTEHDMATLFESSGASIVPSGVQPRENFPNSGPEAAETTEFAGVASKRDLSVDELIRLDLEDLAFVKVAGGAGTNLSGEELLSLSIEELATVKAVGGTAVGESVFDVAELDSEALMSVEHTPGDADKGSPASDVAALDLTDPSVSDEGRETDSGPGSEGNSANIGGLGGPGAGGAAPLLDSASRPLSPPASGDAGGSSGWAPPPPSPPPPGTFGPTNTPVGAITDGDASADTVSESAANGASAGITAQATDADGGDSVTYSLTDDAGGRFAIDTNTGVITVADGTLIDYESSISHRVTVLATSTDGSTSAQTYDILVTDVYEVNTVNGTAGDDTLTGTTGKDQLHGGAGDDTLQGLGGDDVLTGNAGADVLDGGTGSDTASYGLSAAVTVDLGAGTASGGDAAGDAFTSIENLQGSDFDDTLTGDGGDNIIEGKGGGDTLTGGAGSDTASYESSSQAVSVDLGLGAASGGDADGDTLAGFENIRGSAYDDTLTGDGGANVMEGGAGDDILTGGAGSDAFVYCSNDTGSDTITDFTQGDDLIDVTAFDLTDIGDMTIVDDGFGNALVTLPSSNTVTLTGVDHTLLTNGDFAF